MEWDDRYEPLPENHPSDVFRFQRPTLGRPMGMLPSWRKAPSWKDIESDSIPQETGVDSCGEEIQDRDEEAKDESSEVEKKERENERRKERMMMMESTRAIEERKRNEEFEYDSDSEVDDDEAFDELMRDSVSTPLPTHRHAHLAQLPRSQKGRVMQKETVIVISDSDTETNSSDPNTEDEERET